MKNLLQHISMGLVGLALTGCVWHPHPMSKIESPGLEPAKARALGRVAMQPGFAVKKGDIIVVRDPSCQNVLPQKDFVPEEMAVVYKNALLEALAKSQAFGEVVKEDAKPSEGKRVLYLDSAFVELDPGNRALRYFIGWGAGRTKVEVLSTLSADQGAVVWSAADRRIAAYGMFGGNSKNYVVTALSMIADTHGEYFKKAVEENKP